MAYPSTPVLDLFTGIDTTVLSTYNSKWTELINSNLILTNSAHGSANSDNIDFWNATLFGSDCECYSTLVNKSVAADWLGHYLRGTTLINTTIDGYALFYDFIVAGNDHATIQRIDDNVYTILGATVDDEIAVNDVIGIQAVKNTINGFRNGIMTLSRTDTTYTSPGYIGFDIGKISTRIDNFGGGTLYRDRKTLSSIGTRTRTRKARQ